MAERSVALLVVVVLVVGMLDPSADEQIRKR